MRALALDDIKSDMRIGRTLYGGDGRVLLHRGTLLSEDYVEHLRILGFSHMYVEDPSTAGKPEVQGPVAERTRAEAMGAVKEAFDVLKHDRGKVQQDWVGRRVLYNAAPPISPGNPARTDPCFPPQAGFPAPSWVTECMGSHCADNGPLAVTTVQPSPSWRTPAAPALIIGSTVKVMPFFSSRPVLGRP